MHMAPLSEAARNEESSTAGRLMMMTIALQVPKNGMKRAAIIPVKIWRFVAPGADTTVNTCVT